MDHTYNTFRTDASKTINVESPTPPPFRLHDMATYQPEALMDPTN